MKPVAVLVVMAAAGFAAGVSQGRSPHCPHNSCRTTTATTSTTTPTTTTTTFQVPSSIPHDCSVDVAPQLQTWIASVPNNSTLVFFGCFRVEETLEIDGRIALQFTGGTFRQFTPPQDQRPVWRLVGSSGGFAAMTVTGSYTNGGTHDPALQHAHAFDLRGSTVDIGNVTVTDVAGDCVYFGLGYDNTTRSSGGFHDSSCTSIGRNGVSVTAGDDIAVTRNTVTAAGFDAFDIEPNIATGNWGSTNVTVDSNTVGTYYLYAYSIIEDAPISRQEFTNNRVAGALRVFVGSVGGTVPRPQNVTVRNNAGAGGHLDFSHVDGLAVSGNQGLVSVTDCTGVTA